MSREIIYDKRFIKLPNGNIYIPIIQHGSSNCYQWSPSSGRDIPEKNWFNIDKYKENGEWKQQLFFTENDLKKLAANWKTFENFKTRNKMFKPDEFEKWFLNGIKNAKTIEEYDSYGIAVWATISISEEKPTFRQYCDKTRIQKSEDILPKIESLKNKAIQNGFTKEPTITIAFEGRDVMKRLPKRKRNNIEETDEYYIIGYESGSTKLYIHQKTPIRFIFTHDKKYAKKFRTEKEATKWLEKYDNKLNCHMYTKSEKWKVIQTKAEANI